jgi:hypothetical protein
VKRSQPLIAVGALACAGFAVCASVSAQSTSAAPAADAVATRFELRSPAGCGSAEAFVAKVQRRSERIRLLPEAPGARSLIVEIQRADAAGALIGTVTVVEPDGATRARRLKAKSCDEAMEGLSLIATVTLDPEALLSEPAKAPPPVAPPPPAPPPPAVKPAPPPARTVPVPARYRLSFGIAGSALFEASPQPAFGGSAAVTFEARPGEVWSPLLRLSLLHAQRRGLAHGAGDANFAFTVPALDVCPVRLGPSRLAIRPCAFGGIGLLKVWGTEAYDKKEHERASGSAGMSLLLAVRLSKALEIIADGRAGLALVRDEFAFDEVVFFKTRPLLFSAGAGLAGGFP